MFLKTVVSLTAGMFYSSRLLFGRRAQCIIRPGECRASPCQSLTFLPARHTLLAVLGAFASRTPRGCSHHPSFLAAYTQRLFQSLKHERLLVWKVWPVLVTGHDLDKPPGISRMHFLKCCSWWDGPFGFLQQQQFVALLLALGHLGRDFLQVGADINVPSHVFQHQRIF